MAVESSLYPMGAMRNMSASHHRCWCGYLRAASCLGPIGCDFFVMHTSTKDTCTITRHMRSMRSATTSLGDSSIHELSPCPRNRRHCGNPAC
eukprot:2346678-Amphidinium_carterae.2